MKLNGSQILVKCLLEQGVDTVFGYPGGAILNVYDELFRYRKQIRHILTSHEQGASHAADGYARATGKTGVCLATSGPGATNLVTGIATAYMDSVPIVAITCNVGTALLGRDSFQEIDITGVTMPITKHNYIVREASQLATAVRNAFRIAREGRPGPVLIDITKSATAEMAEYEPVLIEPVPPCDVTIRSRDLDQALKLIAKAKRPYVLAGGGAVIANTSDALREFVEKLDAPVADTLMGKGAFDGTDPRYTGMIGMHGTKASNLGVSGCDLLVAVGVRFSDRVTGNAKRFARGAKILQIDVDAAEINKNVMVDCSVIGDANEILKRLNEQMEQHEHTEWMQHISELKKQYPLQYDHNELTGPFIVEEIYRVTGGDAIIVTEVGQHQMWAAQFYRYHHPHQLITSGGLGTMGYGLGAAIGAKTGCPDRTVINVAGDGCFRMNMNELITAVKHNIPVIEIVINNHVLGMVRQWQTLFYGCRYSHTILPETVDYVKLAEAMGAIAFRIEKKEEFAPALEKAIAAGRPVLLDCVIDQDDKVFPMVPAGQAIDEVFDQSDMEKE